MSKQENMGCWSAENATKAFLKTMKMVSAINCKIFEAPMNFAYVPVYENQMLLAFFLACY